MSDEQYKAIVNLLEQQLLEQRRTNAMLERGPLLVYVNGDTDFLEIADQINAYLKGYVNSALADKEEATA